MHSLVCLDLLVTSAKGRLAPAIHRPPPRDAACWATACCGFPLARCRRDGVATGPQLRRTDSHRRHGACGMPCAFERYCSVTCPPPAHLGRAQRGACGPTDDGKAWGPSSHPAKPAALAALVAPCGPWLHHACTQCTPACIGCRRSCSCRTTQRNASCNHAPACTRCAPPGRGIP